MAGEDRGGLGQGQQAGRDRLDDGVEVAVGASGCAGAAVEEGVAGEDDAFAVLPAEGGRVEAHGAGGVAGGGEDLQFGIADAQYVAVSEFVVEVPGGVHHFPEHTVRGVQVDGCAEAFCRLLGAADVVVVGVGQQDLLHGAACDGAGDLVDVVGGVNDDHGGVIADDPDVVVDVPAAAVQREGAGGDDSFNTFAHATLLEFHDRAQHAAGLHGFECFVDVFEADALGDEAVQVEAAEQVLIHEFGEVAGGQGVAVPCALDGAAAAEHLIQRDVPGGAGCGHTHEDDAASQVACLECLLEGGGDADSVDDEVCTEAAGEFLDGFDGVDLGGVHGVGCAVLACACQLLFVDVDGDDGGCATELCACDCCGADAAAADDCNGLAALELTGVQNSAQTCGDAATEQADCCVLFGADVSGDLGALTGCDKGLLSEGTDTQRGGELGAVLEGHLLGCVVGCEAVLRLALAACAALAADGTPVEDDQVAGGDVGDVIADSLNDTCGLVAEQVGEVLADAAGDVVVVGLADTAGEDLDECFSLAGVGYVDGGDCDGRVLGEGYDSLNLVHGAPLLRRG